MATRGDDGDRVVLSDEERVKEVLGKAVLGLWQVVNELTRLKPTRRERFCVSIFGSARIRRGSPGYEVTRRTAKALAEMGCDIVTGGGPGLMQAANEGASAARRRGRSIGIRVELPFEQHANPFVGEVFEHRTFFTRLHQFVIASDAFIVAPGGIGTVLETLMIWQLLQVRHVVDVPLVLVGGMWPGLVRWAKDAMLATDPPLANAADLDIPHCVSTAEEAIEILREHHERWLAAAPPPRAGKARRARRARRTKSRR